MSDIIQDFHQYAREQLSQAIQEQDVLEQAKAIRASFDFIRRMREIENMKPITQEELGKVSNAILDIAQNYDNGLLNEIEGETDAFYCGDEEYHIHYLDGIIPVYVPFEEAEDDDEIYEDEHVMEAIIEREEHDLLKDIEGDKHSVDYFSEHNDGFSDEAKKKLEEMRRAYSEH
jgi:hypothetical protein